MSVSTSALSTYVDQSRKELLAKAVAGANTFSTNFVETIQGIKAGTQLQRKFFSVVPGYRVNENCPTISGTTTFTQKLLSSELIVVHDAWCADDLAQKLAPYLPAGANNNESFEIPNEIIDDIVAQMARDLAVTAWQGKRITPTTNALNANIEGWLFRLINNGSDSYSGSTFKPSSTYTSLTSSNFIAAMDDFASAIPAPLQTLPLEIRAPFDAFNAGKIAYRNAYGAGSLEFLPEDVNGYKLLGYDNIVVRRDDGLNGAKVCVMSVANGGNFIWNVDASSDQTEIKVGYDGLTDKTWYRIKAAVGTECKFETEIGILNYNTGALAN